MAKHLVRYLLEGNGSVPSFVECGGFFQQNEELIGRSVDDTKRHLPASVHKMTRAELVLRATELNPSLDEEEVEEMVDSFLAQIGLSNLA